jgi:hypothetical protein
MMINDVNVDASHLFVMNVLPHISEVATATSALLLGEYSLSITSDNVNADFHILLV